MDVIGSHEFQHLENELNQEKWIPRKWRNVILTTFKNQVAEIEEPEEIEDIIDAWAWMRKRDPLILITLKLFAQNGAATPYFLAVDYLFEQGVEIHYQKKKDVQRLASRFRRVCHKLYRAGLLTGIAIKPEEVGPGKYSVTIWIAPFAKEKEIDSVRKFYVDIVEGRVVSTKKEKKKPKDLTLHNRKVKVFSILDRYKANPQFYDYFKCPKKHPDGLTSHQKVKSRHKSRKRIHQCPECQRELIMIPFEEFMELKKNILFKRWNIKD